ncbi:hypothetical protein [Nostoc sp. UIC 10607]
MKKVVFVCMHNSRRSPMAEAFAHTFGKNKIAVTMLYERSLLR